MTFKTKLRSLIRMRREVTEGVGTLKGILAELKGVNKELKRQDKACAADSKVLQDVRWELQQQRKYLEVVRHSLHTSTMNEVSEFIAGNQLDFVDTLMAVADRKLSFARFGDGELRLMLRPDHNLKFQRGTPAVRADLRSVFTYSGYDSDRLLLGFPHEYRNLHWSGVWLDIWPDLKPLLRTDVTYGDSHVTRPLFFEQMTEQGVKLWRRIWEDRDICVVTGRDSRFELAPVLFDNIRSARFVHSEPTNAHEDLPRLLEVLAAQDAELYLIALGPTGTILAAELSNRGGWAVDIGHISSSWDMIYQGAPLPERLGVTRPKAEEAPDLTDLTPH